MGAPSSHMPASHMPRCTPAKMATLDWVASKGHRACPLSSSPSCCSEVIWRQREQVLGTLGALESGSTVHFLMSPYFFPSPLLDPCTLGTRFTHPNWSVLCTKLTAHLGFPPTPMLTPKGPPSPLYPIAAAHRAEGVRSTGEECLRVPGNKNTNVVVALILENPKL